MISCCLTPTLISSINPCLYFQNISCIWLHFCISPIKALVSLPRLRGFHMSWSCILWVNQIPLSSKLSPFCTLFVYILNIPSSFPHEGLCSSCSFTSGALSHDLGVFGLPVIRVSYKSLPQKDLPILKSLCHPVCHSICYYLIFSHVFIIWVCLLACLYVLFMDIFPTPRTIPGIQ